MAHPRHGVTDVVSDKVLKQKHWGLFDREEDRQRSPTAESHTVIFHDHVQLCPFFQCRI